MSQSSKAIFLSYASEDVAAARRICDALQGAGIDVWFDQGELRGGDSWDQKIRRQIRDCALFIPIVSANTQARTEGYFRLEWRLADQRTHLMGKSRAFLVPVCIDDMREADADIPDSFAAVQWTRLRGGGTPPAFVERVQGLLAPEVQISSAGPVLPTVANSRPRKSIWHRALLPIVAFAVVLGGGYLMVDHFGLSKRQMGADTQSGTALQSATRTPISTPAPEKSIAVLPFVDMSEKKDQEYFSDGLSEELIDHLAHAEGLKVIARTSSFQFKGKSEDVRSIASQLGVANLLEGSVRKSGKELRISAQLVRASDGLEVWSQTYERSLTDVFKVQDEIAAKVADALRAALSPSDRSKPMESNTEAYNLLLKANYLSQQNGVDNAEQALIFLQQAIGLDPAYAAAWVEISDLNRYLGESSRLSRTEARTRAFNAVERALAISPDLSAAHRTLGAVYRDYDWNWNAANLEFAKALELDPDNFWAQDDLALLVATETGNLDGAIEALRRDLARDPLDTAAFRALGGTYWAAGRLVESAASFEQLLSLNPTFASGQAWYANTLLFMGKGARALAALQKEPDKEERLKFLPSVYWSLGRRADANATLLELRNKFGRADAFSVAEAYAYRKDADAAFEWLHRAYQLHSDGMTEIKYDPYLRDLRTDPRYKTLLRQMNLPE